MKMIYVQQMINEMLLILFRNRRISKLWKKLTHKIFHLSIGISGYTKCDRKADSSDEEARKIHFLNFMHSLRKGYALSVIQIQCQEMNICVD